MAFQGWAKNPLSAAKQGLTADFALGEKSFLTRSANRRDVAQRSQSIGRTSEHLLFQNPEEDSASGLDGTECSQSISVRYYSRESQTAGTERKVAQRSQPSSGQMQSSRQSVMIRWVNAISPLIENPNFLHKLFGRSEDMIQCA
jgi:hypothetical protein